MSRTKAFGIGIVLAAGTALVLWSSCGASHKEPQSESDAVGTAEPAAPASAHGTTAHATAPAATEVAGAIPPSPDTDAAAPTTDAGPTDGGAGLSIVRAVGKSDPRDLSLLSRIERELRRDPPPEVHALIERRKLGATRDELTRRARELPDLQLRVLVLRWVDEAFGGTSAGQSPPAPASGSASPLVKPFEPKR